MALRSATTLLGYTRRIPNYAWNAMLSVQGSAGELSFINNAGGYLGVPINRNVMQTIKPAIRNGLRTDLPLLSAVS